MKARFSAVVQLDKTLAGSPRDRLSPYVERGTEDDGLRS